MGLLFLKLPPPPRPVRLAHDDIRIKELNEYWDVLSTSAGGMFSWTVDRVAVGQYDTDAHGLMGLRALKAQETKKQGGHSIGDNYFWIHVWQ